MILPFSNLAASPNLACRVALSVLLVEPASFLPVKEAHAGASVSGGAEREREDSSRSE